jgi:uncharacterized protein with HEPN domain
VSPRNWQNRLQDILTCANNIEIFTFGMNFETFLEDQKTIRAVAFELTTMGEAACAIPLDIQEKYPKIPWGKMQGIRNVLVHEYFRLDEEIIWETCRVDIPQLIEMLQKIIYPSNI